MTISFIRTIILYMLIIISMRLMGKRQLSDMQTSELVVTLLISNLATVSMQDTALPISSGVIPMLTLIAIEIIISIVMLKFPPFRTLITGKPVVVISNGNIDQDAMKKLRFTIEDLMSGLRQLSIFDIKDVYYGIVETNGKLTILKKRNSEPPDAETLNIKLAEKGISAVVINDGIVSDYALTLCGQNKNWLDKILRKEKKDLNKVFMMTVNQQGDYKIIEQQDDKRKE